MKQSLIYVSFMLIGLSLMVHFYNVAPSAQSLKPLMALSRQEEPPPGNPNHIEPTEFCTAEAPPGKMACMCMTYDKGAGCKMGEREMEHFSCKSYCWKKMCKCCIN